MWNKPDVLPKAGKKIEIWGLPKEWVFVKAKIITHRCKDCQGDLTERQIGRPQVVALK